jgi:XTP/dITP diphosphohydrolase
MNDDAPLNGGMMQVEGEVRGWITEEEHGAGGFGYDPVFIPDGYDKTFGELPAETKNRISHRARAMQSLANYLDRYQV